MDLDFTQHLSVEARDWFELWAARAAALQNHTERALRAVLDRDRRTYLKALEALRPGAGPATRLQVSIWLCKAAMHIHNLSRPDLASLPLEFRRLAEASHSISLNWGPAFAERFTTSEAARIWQGFDALDNQLRAPDGEDYVPGYQSGPIPYNLERMRSGFSVVDFIASW